MAMTETISGGPEHDPWSTRQKSALGIGVAAVVAVAAGTMYQYDRSQKLPTPEEQRAQASIQEVFATMTTGDIMECSVSGPPVAKAIEWPLVGPIIGERAHIPALSVNVKIEPGNLDESKEIRSIAGRYSAEIVWHSLRLESRIRFIPSYKKSPDAHIQNTNEPLEINSTVYNYVLPFQQTKNLRVNMPLNSTSNTTAIIDIVPVVGELRLIETTQDKLEIIPTSFERELVGEPCLSLSALTRRNQIRDVTLVK